MLFDPATHAPSVVEYRPAWVDIETYYSKRDYTLSKLTYEQYSRDERRELQMVSIVLIDGTTYTWDCAYHTTQDLYTMLQPATTQACFHNTNFDASFLAEAVGMRFWRYSDTLAMARYLIGENPDGKKRFSLNDLAALLGLGQKIAGTLDSVEGKYRSEWTAEESKAMLMYCEQDTQLTKDVYFELFRRYGAMRPEAMRVMSWVYENCTNPRIIIDPKPLEEYIETNKQTRSKLAKALGVSQRVLRSTKEFPALIEQVTGALPDTKINPDNGKESFQLSKNDQWMSDTLASTDGNGNPSLASMYCQARMFVNSNIGPSRAIRMMGVAERGPAPVFFRYCGATNTGRLAGADKINWQNQPKKYLGETHPIRYALRAPEGHVFMGRDSSQIEARVNAQLAGEHDLLDQFRDPSRDVYTEFVMRMLNVPAEEAAEQRQMGKVAILSLGYGAGVLRFREICNIAWKLGLEAEFVAMMHAFYRSHYREIVRNWYSVGDMLPFMASDTTERYEHPSKGLTFEAGGMRLPTGYKIKYDNLQQEPDEKGRAQWTYGMNKRIYGAKMVENICQSLSYQMIEENLAAMLAAGLDVVIQEHDKLICLVPVNDIEKADATMKQIMNTPPVWWPDIPLASDTGHHECYAEVKC